MGKQPPILVPQVNINGTSAEELIRQQLAVMDACDALLRALGDAAPHGRDYQTYTRPTETHLQADVAHRGRVALVQQVKQSAERIALAIQAQQRGK